MRGQSLVDILSQNAADVDWCLLKRKSERSDGKVGRTDRECSFRGRGTRLLLMIMPGISQSGTVIC